MLAKNLNDGIDTAEISGPECSVRGHEVILFRTSITFSYISLPSARDLLLIRPAPLAHGNVIFRYFMLRYGRQIDYEHRTSVLIVW